MFDVNDIEKQARAELAKEQGDRAKAKIKDHLKKIAAAQQVVDNLKAEYAVLLKDIGT